MKKKYHFKVAHILKTYEYLVFAYSENEERAFFMAVNLNVVTLNELG